MTHKCTWPFLYTSLERQVNTSAWLIKSLARVSSVVHDEVAASLSLVTIKGTKHITGWVCRYLEAEYNCRVHDGTEERGELRAMATRLQCQHSTHNG